MFTDRYVLSFYNLAHNDIFEKNNQLHDNVTFNQSTSKHPYDLYCIERLIFVC